MKFAKIAAALVAFAFVAPTLAAETKPAAATNTVPAAAPAVAPAKTEKKVEKKATEKKVEKKGEKAAEPVKAEPKK